MTKFLLLLGTRPEAIKLFPVVHALRRYPDLTVRTCATGQHRAVLDEVLALAGVVPDSNLAIMTPGQSLDALTGRLLVGIGEVLDRERPDRVIVQGDTATALAGAVAAYHRRIPIAHVEAGLRSGDLLQPWPEEGARRMISAIADLHFAPTRAAAAALAREGVTRGVHVTGNTVIDAVFWMQARIAADPALADDMAPVAHRLAGRRIILVTAHRRENLGSGMAGIGEALRRLADRPDVAILFPTHPNPAIGLALDGYIRDHPRIVRVPPLGYASFVRALDMSDLVLTDSGGIQEEAPALGRPVLVMRSTTERPEGIEAGTARLVGTDPDRIVKAVELLLDDDEAYASMARAHNPYGDGRAADRIARVLAGTPPICGGAAAPYIARHAEQDVDAS